MGGGLVGRDFSHLGRIFAPDQVHWARFRQPQAYFRAQRSRSSTCSDRRFGVANGQVVWHRCRTGLGSGRRCVAVARRINLLERFAGVLDCDLGVEQFHERERGLRFAWAPGRLSCVARYCSTAQGSGVTSVCSCAGEHAAQPLVPPEHRPADTHHDEDRRVGRVTDGSVHSATPLASIIRSATLPPLCSVGPADSPMSSTVQKYSVLSRCMLSMPMDSGRRATVAVSPIAADSLKWRGASKVFVVGGYG